MKQKINFILNDLPLTVEVEPTLPLIDFIREKRHLHGTKLVCKEGDCGACTVMVGELNKDSLSYKTVTSCIYPIINVNGCHVVTIEGLNQDFLTPQQKSFADEGASQCGFCTPGFIVSLTCYFLNNDTYNYIDAVNSLGGNVCRCTGYESIKRAVHNLLDDISKKVDSNIELLIKHNIIPEYFREVKEKLSSIPATHNQNGTVKKIVGGGSDLLVQIPDKLLHEDTSPAKEIVGNEISETENEIILQAGVTFEQFKRSDLIKDYFPWLPKQLNLVASLPIRNMATIAGNIVNASPIGDYTIILLALNSTLVISNGSREREANLSEFYLGYKIINLEKGEFIKEIKFPKPTGDYYFNFEKVSKRTHLDIASVNSACLITLNGNTIENCRISAGGVSAIPKYLSKTSSYLRNKEISPQIINESINIAQNEIAPISDIRGSEDYKRLLLSQLIKAHFITIMPELMLEDELV